MIKILKKVIFLLFIALVFTSCEQKTGTLEPPKTEEAVYYKNPFETLEKGLPTIELEKKNYDVNEQIIVKVNGAEKSDYVGLFDLESEPCGSVAHKKIKVNDQKEVTFELTELNLSSGDYAFCLYKNKTFTLLDRVEFQIDDNDENDYKIVSASAKLNMVNKKSSFKINIIPSTDKKLTYTAYWSKDGNRLENYTALFRIEKSDAVTGFDVEFNDNMIMPEEANEIEISITEGKSTSYYLKMNDDLKVSKSRYLYNFQVLTDIHANPDSRYGHWNSHLYHALLDIKCLSGNTSGIFTVGDNTDMGSTTHYDYLFSTVKSVFGDNIPNMYYSVGNHDYMYSSDSVGGFDRAVDLFKSMTGMENSYYSIELNGYKYIFLSSDEKTVSGSMGNTQLDWFKEQLSNLNKEEFAFIFLHQPLKNTTSGTLPGQDWFGMNNVSDEIQALLKDYPNVIFFTGHTHYELESVKSTNLGHGENANYINNASVAYLWSNTYEETVGGQCNFIEVYEDYILIKGRDLFENKWVSSAQFVCYLY